MMDMICIVLKKSYYSQPLLQLLFWKYLPTEFLRYLLELLKVSIVPLKKRTVKQIPPVLLG